MNVKLSSYAKVQGGYAYKSKEFIEQGIPVLKIKNIRFGYINYLDIMFISESVARNTPSFFTEPGDILISMTGSGPNAPASLVGRVARVKENEPKALINQRVGRIILHNKEDISKRFLFYYLSQQKVQDYLVANSSGSANQANISNKIIESIEIPDIGYDRSVLIADILASFDDKISKNKEINITLEQMAQAIFKSWFVNFDPVKAKMNVLNSGGSKEEALNAAMSIISGKSEAELIKMQAEFPNEYDELKNTAELFPSSMQDSELGHIPAGWSISDLGSEFNITMGQSPPGHTYNENNEGIPFFQGRRDFGWRYPTERVFCTLPKRFSAVGDTLLSVRAPVGDINKAKIKCCIGRGLASIRHNSMSADYTYYSLLNLGQKFLKFNSEGTVFGSINQKDLKAIKLIKCPDEYIKSFSKYCDPIDSQIRINENESESLRCLKETLLPKMISGDMELYNV